MKYFKKLISVILTLLIIIGSVSFASGSETLDEFLCETSLGFESDDISEDELYDLWLENLFYGDNGISLFGVSAGEKLSPLSKKLYDFIKSEITAIYDTDKSEVSTSFTVTGETLASWGAEVDFMGTDVNVAFSSFLSQLKVSDVIEALMHDCPYELFWYDKVTGVKQNGSLTNKGDSFTVNRLTLKFAVSNKYRASNYVITDPMLDTSCILSAKNALTNAMSIVEECKNLSDYEKIKAYKDIICSITSYDYSAAESANYSYDNSPWQMINVFDGDESTKSVCEGYSKAFQYLMDNSSFNCSVSSIAVIGTMSGGSHMWNIVNIGNKNYLVDVTNSDQGTIGYGGSLFLVGAEGSVLGGYSVSFSTYLYSNDTIDLWGYEDDGALSLSKENFTPGLSGNSHIYEESVCILCGNINGKCGENLDYKINNGVLTISGSGEMYDFSQGEAPWSKYSENITKIIVSEGVTNIGNNAFYNLTEAEEVILPEGILSLGKNSFRGLSKLGTVILPQSLKTIGDAAFYGASALSEIIIPENVETIGSYAFYKADNLKKIYFEGEAPSISDKAFMNLYLKATYLDFCTSWNEDNLKDYGGNIEWKKVTYCDFYGHSEVVDEAINPSCTNEGLSEGKHCSICGEVTLAQEILPKAEHNFGVWYESVKVSCDKNGEMRRDCGDCSYFETSVIPFTGHKIVVDEIIYPTCTESGLAEGSHCSACGKVIEVQLELEALGHDYQEDVTEPSCLDGGYTVFTCLNCGDSYVDNFTSAKGHNPVIDNKVDATCTESGLTEGSHCSVCNEVIVKQTVIPSKDHSYNSVITPPTCTSQGYTTYTCLNCGDSYKGNYVNKLGHTLEYSVTEPDCLREGYTSYKCKKCDYSVEKDNIVPALGHSYKETVKNPTCTEYGFTTYTCSNCGDSYKGNYKASLGHNETVVKGYDATCTEKGLTDGKKCTECGEITVKQTEIKAKGHTYTSKVTNPTCSSKGYTTFTCSECKNSYKTNYVSATNNHVYSNDKDTSCNNCGYVRVIKVKTIPMYRMYDPNSSEHFYTGSVEERDILIAAGWNYEGVGFNFPKAGRPVHRLYEPKTGEHLYTMDENEKNQLLEAGWNYEGVAFNSAGDNEVPQYRLHNPNATRGAYHFTGSIEERDWLISLGWEYQGIGFYSCMK